jgi:hypothetical protein
MKKADIHPMPEYFDRYIHLVNDEDIYNVLNESRSEIENIDAAKLKSLGDKIYAPGKWTIKNILQHIIDAERVFSYRALRISRNDSTALPGFDENLFAKESGADNRGIDDLLEELTAVRKTTIQLFQSFSVSSLQNKGICSGKEISVLALGFIIAGHQIHHLNIVKERYEPL